MFCIFMIISNLFPFDVSLCLFLLKCTLILLTRRERWGRSFEFGFLCSEQKKSSLSITLEVEIPLIVVHCTLVFLNRISVEMRQRQFKRILKSGIMTKKSNVNEPILLKLWLSSFLGEKRFTNKISDKMEIGFNFVRALIRWMSHW